MKKNKLRKSIVRRFSALFIISNIALICLAQYAGGDGSEDNPYQIARAEHLDAVRQNLGSHFIQTEDINLDVPPFNENEGWIPIGSNIDRRRFTGTYDGNGHTIDGLFINRPESEYPQGLFGFSRRGLVKNVGVINVNVTGHDRVGGLAGEGWDANYKNSYATGTVNGNDSVGVLVGRVRGCVIIKCYSDGTVNGDDRYIGGLTGYFWNGTAINSYSKATVNSTARYVGGLIGWNRSDGGEGIINCYSIGSVPDGGGLTGSSSQGGIWTNSYWDTEASGQDDSACGLGRTSRQMMYPEYLDDPDTFADWDFESGEAWVHDETRTINDGYPVLHYQEPPVIDIDPPVVTAELITVDDIDIIRLSWEAVEDANSYRIYASLDPESEDWGEPAAIVAETHYTEAINNNRRRFFYVVASIQEAP